jgi:hypothetical protein
MVTLSTRSYKLGNKLYLNEHRVVNPDAQTVNSVVPTNHVFCCDVSGSMYSSLPKMREQLKARIKSLLHEKDTITIIAFADGKDCYVVKSLASVATEADVKSLNAAIDKYLQCHCCTDFVLPIDATHQLIEEHPNQTWNWVFLSDGGHNCGPFSHVVAALNLIQGQISDATIIEYGYYADSKNLTKMAEQLGGAKIPAEDFESYVPVIESSLSGGKYTPKVEIDVTENADALRVPQYFYLDGGTNSIHVLVANEDGLIYVPTHIDTIYSLSSKIIGVKDEISDPTPAYAAAYVMSDILNYNLVEDILNSIADVKFIEMYQGAFGKQKLFEFQAELRSAIFDEDNRGRINPDFKPNEDRYCVMDFMNEICNGDNLIRVADPSFSYKRIGTKQVSKVILTEEEKLQIMNAATKKEAAKLVDSAKGNPVKMTMVNKGYPVSNFTWNEERANLSALIKVDVTLELPENKVGLKSVESFVFRNYTIIKDGILNINVLPLILDQETYGSISKHAALVINEVRQVEDGKVECSVDLSNLPVLNKRRVRSSKMKRMTKLALMLNDYKFELKYLGYLKKEICSSDVPVVNGNYTEDQRSYLASLGITDAGYQPKVDTEKSGDFYMALTLNSNFVGFSSIPAIESIDKKIKAGKNLTPSEQYMQKVMAFVDAKYLKVATEEQYREAIKDAFNQITIKKRKVAEELSQMKFAMIVARKWFSDCESMDQNTDTITSDFGQDLKIEYRFTEKKQNL